MQPMPIISDGRTRTIREGIPWLYAHGIDIEHDCYSPSVLNKSLPLICICPEPLVDTLLVVNPCEDRFVQGDDLATPDHLAGLASTPSGSLPRSQLEALPLVHPHQRGSAGYTTHTMTKKRRSLQSIVTPSFLLQSSFTTHRRGAGRSHSCSYVNRDFSSPVEQLLPTPSPTSCHESQPSPMTPDDSSPFLLDDDPFANLTASAVVSPRSSIDKRPTSPVVTRTSLPVLPPIDTAAPTTIVPRSPLSPPDSVQSSYFGTVMPQTTSPSSRFRSLRIKPAYEKPAFASRPSLPSLHTLTHTSLSPPRKVRKGRVGASLPFEPWENMESDDYEGSGTSTPSTTRPSSPLDNSMRMLTQMPAVDAEYRDPIGSDQLSAFGLPALPSDRNTFTFHDNISTPSLELSSASLSRSLSLESMSLSEMSLGDSELDQFGNFASEYPITRSMGDHDIDHPSREAMNLLLPSFCRVEPTTDRGDNLAYDISLPTISELPLEFQPGSSADTVRTSVFGQIPGQGRLSSDMQTDSTGWSSSRTCSSTSQFAKDGTGGTGRGGYNGYSPAGNGGGWGGGNGDDDDGDGGRRRPTHRAVLSGSSTPGSSSDEEISEEDYGEPISHSGGPCMGMNGTTDSEDDVPLAQRIPTALKAQRTIRQKFREERDKRRRQRALEAEKRDPGSGPTVVSNGEYSLNSGVSSSQEAQVSKQVQGRPRTRTLPGNTPRPFAPEDLARKLQDVQVAGTSRNLHRRPSTSPRNPEVTKGGTRMVDEPHHPFPLQPAQHHIQPISTNPNHDGMLRILRSMRSFHRPETQRSEGAPLSADMTAVATSKLTRPTSRGRSKVREGTSPPSAWQCPPLPSRLSVENSPPILPLLQPRLSTELSRKVSRNAHPSSATSTKTSVEIERSPKPPLPPQAATLAAANIKTQQRIFIGDMQRFNVVEIDNNTSADDVVVMIRNQGSLTGFAGRGNWMLFEVAQDFGMERPMRGYELLSDVQASWNKDKLVNMFVLRMTPLAALLGREAIPSSSPTHGGYVEWESKKGKWSKRWLRLREHSLWLSKRDNGKDETLLCSLSNFDAYFVTRATHKAPKPFCFAVKSTDNLSFFENMADYLHTFSCQPQDGQKWVEKILIARSYVLHQERHVLFNPKAAAGNAVVSVQRAGTRKVRPTQPLVNIPPSEVFEPGSLLSKT
ncbi:hypothetical protein AX15_003793 [Amanita polypyramis BW_CC]|nr:hypothetical protein AX15_003793 [Amanita polypyramis BW_CC]